MYLLGRTPLKPLTIIFCVVAYMYMENRHLRVFIMVRIRHFFFWKIMSTATRYEASVL